MRSTPRVPCLLLSALGPAGPAASARQLGSSQPLASVDGRRDWPPDDYTRHHLFAAQYPNGGFPQIYPLAGGYHDALTLRPCAARTFEPIAACASESATLVEFLMTLSPRSPTIEGALDDAVAWFSRVALHDVVWDRTSVAGSGLTKVPGSPLLWARLYEIGSDRPIFGDRDRTIHYSVTELSSERRLGYGWYGTWPQRVLDAQRRPVLRVRP